MKKLLTLALLLISFEGWAANCKKINLAFGNEATGWIWRCDLGEEICFYSEGENKSLTGLAYTSDSISCFPTNTKAK